MHQAHFHQFIENVPAYVFGQLVFVAEAMNHAIESVE